MIVAFLFNMVLPTTKTVVLSDIWKSNRSYSGRAASLGRIGIEYSETENKKAGRIEVSGFFVYY